MNVPIFILVLTPGFNGLDKDNFKTRRYSFKFWDLSRLILEVYGNHLSIFYTPGLISMMALVFPIKSKSKSKSKKTLFNVGQCKQYNISSHLKWVLVADKSMHMVIYNKIIP